MILVGLERKDGLDKFIPYLRSCDDHIMLAMRLGLEISSKWAGVGRWIIMFSALHSSSARSFKRCFKPNPSLAPTKKKNPLFPLNFAVLPADFDPLLSPPKAEAPTTPYEISPAPSSSSPSPSSAGTLFRYSQTIPPWQRPALSALRKTPYTYSSPISELYTPILLKLCDRQHTRRILHISTTVCFSPGSDFQEKKKKKKTVGVIWSGVL